ncbi:FTR1 family protein [Nitrospina sp. 32_T5]|uniref:FTR1 family protein n=1 Tax=unclassified Nitrospina TaxID=2638683 RepID=UPI003F969C38
MKKRTSDHKKNFCLLSWTLYGLLLAALIFPTTGLAQADTAAVQSKIKKVIMMMNIVDKEYTEGIANGQVINAAEYEESKVFLDQAFERFQSVSDKAASPQGAKEIVTQYRSLKQDIQDKKDPAQIRSQVQTINSGLVREFAIQISQTPAEPVDLARGQEIYMSNCRVCHGVTGKGDGPVAHQLEPRPAVLADPAITGDQETVAYDNFQIINVGIANTAMVGWADQLSEQDIWNVTYFIRTFSNDNVNLPLLAAGTGSGSTGGSDQYLKTFESVEKLVESSWKTFKEGDAKFASEQAFDAYMTYEKIEGALVTKDKELGLRLESAFGRLQAEMKRNAPRDLVENLVKDIKAGLAEGKAEMTQDIGFTGLFIQSFSIIVREGFEAILIIAALITFLVRSRNQDKLKTIYVGVGIGIVGSFITYYILQEILKISMASQELLEGWIMLIAVVVLFYVSYWLISKIETAKWQKYITHKMQDAVSTGSAWTLGVVAFLSVYREGFETVLFYKALYMYAGETTGGIVPGFLAGCAVLAVVFFLINKLGVRVPIKWFFGVTSVFLYFMAFVFMGKGLHELQMGGQLSATPAEFAPEISVLGMYPTWETFIGQMILLLAFVGAIVYTFIIKQEKAARELKTSTNQLQKNITSVHDLVEHISHHAKRCEIFLKDTRDQDLKELSQHLKEIDEKVHELFDQVKYFENQLQDEYDRISQPIGAKEKGLH